VEVKKEKKEKKPTSNKPVPNDSAFLVSPTLWTALLLTVLTQIRVKSQASAREILKIELVKSGIVTIFWVWWTLDYVLTMGQTSGPVSILHQVVCIGAVLVFNWYVSSSPHLILVCLCEGEFFFF